MSAMKDVLEGANFGVEERANAEALIALALPRIWGRGRVTT